MDSPGWLPPSQRVTAAAATTEGPLPDVVEPPALPRDGLTDPFGVLRGAVTDPAAAPAPELRLVDRTPDLVDAVARAQRGDAAAFGEIYDAYVDTIYRYICFRVGDAALAEDLTSETFLRALRRLDGFRWRGRDLGAWLITIARNLITDHYKSARHRYEVPTAELTDTRVEDGPEPAVLAQLGAADLLRAVRQLGPDQQECIVLRFLEGLSIPETARLLGRSEGAVKTLQYRALRSLARLLPVSLR